MLGVNRVPRDSPRIYADLCANSEDRQQIEERGGQVGLRGYPGNGLDAKRMNGKVNRRRGCKDAIRCFVAPLRVLRRQAENLNNDQIQHHAVQRVDRQTHDVIEAGLESGHTPFRAKEDPCERLPNAQVISAPRPCKLRRADSPIRGILYKVSVVVPIEERTLERRREGCDDRKHQDDEHQRGEPDAAVTAAVDIHSCADICHSSFPGERSLVS